MEKETYNIRKHLFLEFNKLFIEKLNKQVLLDHIEQDYKIRLKDNLKPLNDNKIYTMSQDNLRTLREHLEKNIKKGFIRESKSLYSSLVFFVDKPGGGQRLVVNY